MALERALAPLERSKVMRHEGGSNVLIGLALITAISAGFLLSIPLAAKTAAGLTMLLLVAWAANGMRHHMAGGNHPLMGH
jgi:hypothetical protein